MTFGDAGIRKHMHRVIINYAPESTIDADLFLDMIMKLKTRLDLLLMH